MISWVSEQQLALTVSGTTLVSAAGTVVPAGAALIGTCNPNLKGVALSSVTDNASGVTNTYNTATLNYSGFGEVCYFWGSNIQGAPTVFTLNFASTPVSTSLILVTYGGVANFNVIAGPTEVDSTNPGISITPTLVNCTIFTLLSSEDGVAPTVPTNYTSRSAHTGLGLYTADRSLVSASLQTPTWTSGGTPSNQNQLFDAAMLPQMPAIYIDELPPKGRNSIYFHRAPRDESLAFNPRIVPVVESPPQFSSRIFKLSRQHLDQQEHPTWNAVLQPKLQSWELPAQFPGRWLRPRNQAPANEQFLTTQSSGFDLVSQVRAFFNFKQPAQLDSTIRTALSAALMDGELLGRRMWMEPRAQVTFELKPQSLTPVADREQFPAHLEFVPRIQQIEAFFIAAASQILQLTLAAWVWAAHASILGFNLTGNLVSWLWKANIALLVQTLNLVLVAWIWKAFAAVLSQTLSATHVVWKWLPQAPVLLIMLVASAPGVVWRWLPQAPGFFFPIIIVAAQAVWLWIGRALVGGTHFAKVIYGLLQQVGRLRNR